MLELESSPWLFGHRGSRDQHDENTIEAIEAAADAGVVAVEIDVRLCASGQVVVAHDRNLRRVTDEEDDRRIEEVTLDQLEQIELASGGRVPTLQQVLDVCESRGLALNVELKADVPSRLELVRSTLRELKGRSRIVCSSFDPVVLAALRWYHPRVPLGILLEHSTPKPPVGILRTALQAVSIHVDEPLATPQNVEAWQRAGMRVLVWTVNDAEVASDLLDRGVDGIMTDVPRELAALFQG